MTVLSAAGLSVRAADGSSLLSDVSLAVERGETLLVCGRSGSGKTLLAKAFKGLLGDREDLSVEGTVSREGSVGFVFQSPGTQLVRRTVRRDVAFGLENRGVPAAEIEDRVDRHAALLDAEGLLDRNVRDLSGGETTKAALLGVLVTEPDAVILDEPLARLDQPNTALVLDALDRLRAAEAAVVVAEHDLRDLLGRGDRVALLRDGRLASLGPPREVVRDLYDAGVALPIDAEVALVAGAEAVPIAADDPEVESP